MANAYIKDLSENTGPAVSDAVEIDDGANSEYALLPAFSRWLPEGSLINGRLSVTVGSNNLTVALKGLDGNNPSATNPVFVRIQNTFHRVVAALSVTAAAATNWCNAGSSELATKEIDYFVYLGYNATDGVVIGFSRMPMGRIYSDFSATSTNEKFCKISTITNAAAGDAYVNVGRFAATLSAGAGYTWTVPTFTPINLIQYPIFETRALDWTPTLSRSGGAYSNLPTLVRASYQIIGRRAFYSVHYTQHGTPGSSGYQTVTLPFLSSQNASGTGFNLVGAYALAVFVAAATLAGLRLFKYDGTGDAVASQPYGAWGNYEI